MRHLFNLEQTWNLKGPTMSGDRTPKMPGDAKECREHALECMELARTARTPEHKQLLTNLAQSWLNVAAEIERTKALLNEHGTPDTVYYGTGASAAEATQH